jgi:hypothetical protein
VPKGVGEWLIERCCRRQEELREATLVFDVAAAGAAVAAAVAAAVVAAAVVEGAVRVGAGGGGAGDAVPVVAVVAVAVAVAVAAFAGLGEVGVVEVVVQWKGDHVVGVTSSRRDDTDPLCGHGRVERVPPGIDTFLRDLLATSNNAWRVNTSL